MHFESVRGRSNLDIDIQPQIQRALDQGVRVITLGEGSFYLGRPLIVRAPDVVISGKSMELTRLYGVGNTLISVMTPAQYTMNYSDTIKPFASTLLIESNEELTPGMLVHISSEQGMPELASGGYTSHHTGIITGIRDQTIILDRDIEIPFDRDIRVFGYRPQGFTLKSLTLEADNTPYLVEIRNRKGILVDDVRFKTPRQQYMGVFRELNPLLGVSALGIYSSIDVQVKNCTFEYIWYGLMAHEGCYVVRMQDCQALSSRHINNSGIGTDDFLVKDCIAIGCEGGFDSHPTALGTTFINCRDTLSRFPSKFRGRRDYIEDCFFDQGIALSTDPGIADLASDSTLIYKKVRRTYISGGKIDIQAANVSLTDCQFFTGIRPFNLIGKFLLNNVIIDLRQHMTTLSSAVTLTDSPLQSYTYYFDFRNIEIIGPGSIMGDPVEIGVYLPMRSGVTGDLRNVQISGFTKGLVLYGGEEAATRYRDIGFYNINISDCAFGIFQQEVVKQVKANQITFQHCLVQDNAPGYMRLKTDD